MDVCQSNAGMPGGISCEGGCDWSERDHDLRHVCHLHIEKVLYDSTFAGHNRGGLNHWDVLDAIGDPAIDMSRSVAWCVCAWACQSCRLEGVTNLPETF